jgi:hypothetical protein
MIIRAALMTAVLTITQSSASYALDHDLRKDIYEVLGPNAWGMYIILPVPFVALGMIGYLLYKAWRTSSGPSDTTPPPPH